MFNILPRILLYVAFLFLPLTFVKVFYNITISDVLLMCSIFILVISSEGKTFILENVIKNNIFIIPLLIFSLGFLLSLNRSILPYESITSYLQVAFIFLIAYPLLEKIIVDEKAFSYTAFFDENEAPVNYAIFGPRFTFTGELTIGSVTVKRVEQLAKSLPK